MKDHMEFGDYLFLGKHRIKIIEILIGKAKKKMKN
jgi:hypothetical protein